MALTDAEHLPRVLLGDYLSSFYEALVAMRPASMSVRHVRARVVDVISLADGYALALDDGSRVAADYVVLAIGHGMRTETAEDRRLAEYAAACRATIRVRARDNQGERVLRGFRRREGVARPEAEPPQKSA